MIMQKIDSMKNFPKVKDLSIEKNLVTFLRERLSGFLVNPYEIKEKDNKIIASWKDEKKDEEEEEN